MWLQILSYICLIVFIIGLVWRIIRYAGLPIHVRWELYPVAHEKDKPYGGSYLEELDWWHHPRSINLFGEFTVFMREILFFREYFKSKRGFWYFVYPFHIGLFLILIWILLLLMGALLQINGVMLSSTSANVGLTIAYYLTLVVGVGAFTAGIFGSAGLLLKRIINSDLRSYTNPIDYFNLVCILAIFILGSLSWVIEDQTFSAGRNYISGLILFKQNQLGLLTTIFALVSLVFLAYMPFTRMMHYVAKYFTYHKVRWDDEPNMRGSKIENEVKVLMAQQETWSAPHIRQGKSWAEQAIDAGMQEDKK
jgi:nitrate reductase gamma subunit